MVQVAKINLDDTKVDFCMRKKNLYEDKFRAFDSFKIHLKEEPGEILCEREEFLSG